MSTPVTHKEISQARFELERARREKLREMMAEYDKDYFAKLKVLHEQCGTLGHNWRFTHLGPLGHPWFSCTVCSKSRVDGFDEPSSPPTASERVGAEGP